MEVVRNRSGISASQRKYMLDLLKETSMLRCKPVDTPMDPNLKLGEKSNKNPIDKGIHQRVVGKLIHLSHVLSLTLAFISFWSMIRESSPCLLRVYTQ